MGFQTLDANLDNVVQKFLHTFSDDLLANETINWQTVGSSFSGTAAGGATIGGSAITLPAGQTGVGTVVKRTLDLDFLVTTQRALVGDTVQIRALVVESTAGSLDVSHFALSLKANGSTVAVSPVVTSATSLVQYVFDYTLQASNDLEVSFTITSGFATSTASRTFTWSSVDTYYQVQALEQSVDQLTKLNQWPVVSQCVANGIADDTAMLQSEINLAIATSGVLMLKTGTYKITSTLAINGFVRITGFGWDKTKINALLSTSLFEINSKEAFILEDFRIFRDTGNSQIQIAIKFGNNLVSDNLINKGSIIRRLKIDTVNGIDINQCQDLKIHHCEFSSVTPIVLGSLSINNITLIDIDSNTFINATDSRVIYSSLCNNFKISNNRFISNGSNFGNVFLEFNLKNAAHSNLRIYNNTIEHARIYAISIVAGEVGATIKNVDISGNFLSDASTNPTSGSIFITLPNTSTKISDNFIENKVTALYISEATRLLCTDNIINGVSAASKAFRLTNCTYMRKANIETNQPVANTATGSTALTEAPI